MTSPDAEKSIIHKTSENLFNFAIDREDIKIVVNSLPETLQENRVTLEYELQILKIISIGWGITFYMEENPKKNELTQQFWNFIREFSQNLASTTAYMVGKDINYFQVVKERLDSYVAAMDLKPEAPEPAVVIGPEFAKACNQKDDVFVIMAGSRMFISMLGIVKEYLESNYPCSAVS